MNRAYYDKSNILTKVVFPSNKNTAEQSKAQKYCKCPICGKRYELSINKKCSITNEIELLESFLNNIPMYKRHCKDCQDIQEEIIEYEMMDSRTYDLLGNDESLVLLFR